MKKWNRQSVKEELIRLSNEIGRIPRIKDCPNFYATVYNYFDTWNIAIEETFGKSAQDEVYENILNDEIMNMIESGEIASRGALFRHLGYINHGLRHYMDRQGILIPNKWTKERFVKSMKQWRDETGNMPKAMDDHTMLRLAKRFYGGWNNALVDIFGDTNQNSYGHLSDEELLQTIVDFVKKYQRLPLREEFDGKSESCPYWEAITTRFGLQRWSDVYKLVDLSGIRYYHDSKHGTGRIIVYNGVVYLSRQEYLIGKYLDSQGIVFQKEIPYGEESSHIFDFFLVDFNVYIEYYGMETPEYKQRIKEKRSLYGDRNVIEIFKHENTVKRIASEVQRLQLLSV